VALFAGETSENPYLFRVTAKLSQPIAARNLPGLWWRSIHKLALDPTESVPFHVTPQRLLRGKTFDMRLLSRDKTAAQRGDVVALLQHMGFDPVDALLVRRNLRVPGRPGTSLSEWLAVGTWIRPDSYSTADDPLLFLDAKVNE
jgi:hypothetical protein